MIDDLINVVEVGAVERDATTNVVSARVKGLNGEEYGNVPIYSTPGVVSSPYPPDDEGRVVGACITTPNAEGLVGCRDTRTADIYGELEPGDTCIHSHGANQACRSFWKDEQRVIAHLVKDSDGNDMGIIIDGENKTIQLIVSGVVFKLEAETEAVIAVADDSNSSFLSIKPGESVLQSGRVALGAVPPGATALTNGAAVTAAGPANVVSTSVLIGL